MRVSMPAAARTSRAVRHAGSLRACVSRPMNRGPLMPWEARYSMIAAVMAMMCASLNLPSNEAPRWPDVPNATRCPTSVGSGTMS